MFIDTHCHLYLQEFENDIAALIQRADQSGVEKFYLPAIDSETHDAMITLETAFPGQCISMMGLHPCYVKQNFKDELSKIEQWLQKRKFAAIGECGLDFYWDKTYVKEQYAVLEQQAEWALQYDLPIVLHTRNATAETIDVIKHFSAKGLSGIFHCFGGTIEEAEQIIQLGFYLGIGGVVTYKNSGLDKVVQTIGLKNLVLETDAPYLTPVPHRGKRNESSYLKIIAEKVAEICGCALEEVATITTANAKTIFK